MDATGAAGGPLAPVEAAAPAGLLPARVIRAQAVIVGALFRIAEHLVSLVGFLELVLSAFIVGVAVGVILERQLAIGFLDLVLAGLPSQPQNLVTIHIFHW